MSLRSDVESALSWMESKIYNAGYELDCSPIEKIKTVVIKPRADVANMPTIYGHYQEEENYFWFEVEMRFPKILKQGGYDGHFANYMEKWKKAGKLADELFINRYEFEEEE